VTSQPSKESAKQLARSLETALQTANKLGAVVPDVNAKQVQLRVDLQVASTQADVDKVVAQYATAIDDVLVQIGHNDSALGASKQLETAGAGPAPAQTQSSPPGRLSLFFACFALVLSFVAPFGGWFLARRAVNKALIDAGLM
jgi:hypothetical protein